jgi:ComF family protein
MIRDTMSCIFSFILDVLFPRAFDEKLKKMSDAELRALITRPKVPGNPWVRTLFNYRSPFIRELIWQIKYKANVKAVERIAPFLYKEIVEMAHSQIVIVPVPSSAARKKEKGFNQCELIVDALERRHSSEKIRGCMMDISFCINAVRKITHTRRQAKCHRDIRLENLAGAFAADPAEVRGKIIIVIDDVATTGSTLLEIKKTLLTAGARAVYGLALSH